uniref:Transmembrane protein n=1 Tax=Loa loa TaxID=7209 RepID=A0A1I7VRN5_LOALO
MSREIYALLFNLNVVLMAQLKNNHALSTIKKTIFIVEENNLEEVPTFHKIIRIVYVVALALVGIIATIMFNRNILNYQSGDTNQSFFNTLNVIKLLRAQERFRSKPRSSESIVQSTATLTDEKTDKNEKTQEESVVVPNNSISEYSTRLEPKSNEFPTITLPKSRSNAGQDNAYNKISLTQKQRPGWDDVEMMRHGFINWSAIC